MRGLRGPFRALAMGDAFPLDGSWSVLKTQTAWSVEMKRALQGHTSAQTVDSDKWKQWQGLNAPFAGSCTGSGLRSRR